MSRFPAFLLSALLALCVLGGCVNLDDPVADTASEVSDIEIPPVVLAVPVAPTSGLLGDIAPTQGVTPGYGATVESEVPIDPGCSKPMAALWTGGNRIWKHGDDIESSTESPGTVSTLSPAPELPALLAVTRERRFVGDS